MREVKGSVNGGFIGTGGTGAFVIFLNAKKFRSKESRTCFIASGRTIEAFYCLFKPVPLVLNTLHMDCMDVG